MFTAGVRGADGDRIAGAELTGQVILPDGSKKNLSLVEASDGWSGTFDETMSPGSYRLQVSARHIGAELGTGHGDFLVLQQNLELSDPAANPEHLEMLAQLTRRAGGKTIAPEQLPALLREIRESPPEAKIEVESKWQLGDTPRDAWSFFLCVVGLLTSEWYLRKKWGLV
jgi:hypothetical protein